MKKVLIIGNIEVPYRTKFYNELAKKVDLTVIYEREKSSNRDSKWSASEKSNYNKIFLGGININNENAFNLKIFKYIFNKEYDEIIIGCYNSPIQALAILVMKLLRKKYSINIDGNPFLEKKTLSTKLKIMFLKGASKYYIAGEYFKKRLAKIFSTDNVFAYHFGSLYDIEIKNNIQKIKKITEKNNKILVIGQYFDYKGMDIAAEVAKKMPKQEFIFVGMGERSKIFEENFKECTNIEVVPFLQKDDLEKLYLKCNMLVLPSRQECWGLVINEAASFGLPIVSTLGAGAAEEFLKETEFENYLANSGDMEDLKDKIINLLNCSNTKEYKEYLIEKSKKYSIEKMVEDYYKTIEKG